VPNMAPSISSTLNPLPDMESTDEKIIELSRAKLVRLVLASCAFVALGAWLLSFDAGEIRSGRSFGFFYNSPPLVYGLGLLAVVCFGPVGLFGVRKMFDKRPGLVLNSAGVVDNASGVAAGFIPWSDVTGARIHEIHNQKMLVIGVRDPRKYIDRGGPLKRVLHKASYKMGSGPVAISSVSLKMEFPELVALFERYQRKYGGAHAGREG
jgi:hypothetical protein